MGKRFELFNNVINTLIDNEVLEYRKKLYPKKHSNIVNMRYYGKQARRFLDYIYKDCIIYLNRKYELYIGDKNNQING